MTITRTEDVRLPQLSPDASEADRRLLQALYDQFRDTNNRLWALETTLGIAPRKPTALPYATSPLTTKGDLWGFTTTNARVPVGTDGYALVADSAQASGVNYAARATLGANTYTAGQTITEAVGASALTLTGATQTTSQPVINATQTWNAAGVAFTGWKLNVTNTASNGFSKLMDLQVGSATQFSVSKAGAVSAAGSLGGNSVSSSTTITGGGGANPLISTSGALNDGAGAGAGTLGNAPAAGNPTKWLAINDAGTTRYIPSW